MSMYPGAQGNIRFGGKRFWTDCLYPYIQTDYGQAGWMKEEPPVIYAGECQLGNTPCSTPEPFVNPETV